MRIGVFVFSPLCHYFSSLPVLNGLLSGQSNKEIARTHGLSEVTSKHHLKSLRSKLGARNRTHAVCRAIELGIAEETGLAMYYSPV